MFLSLLFGPIIILIVLVIIRIDAIQKDKEEYESSAYHQSTQLSYYDVRKKGVHGEYLAYKSLKQYCAPSTEFLFNVYLPTYAGHTTEIDIIMLSQAGILVIESKDYSGWIFGSESQTKWCQTLPARRRTSQKHFFYNPVMQNRAHIKHLKAFIGEDIPMYSAVVFSDRCTLKDIQMNSTDDYVIYQADLPRVITAINNRNTTRRLSDEDIARYYIRLFPFSQVGEAAKEQHKMDLQQMRNQEKARLKCPRCNGNLVVRTAKKGISAGRRFYGCARYPECRYTKSIDE